MKPDSDSDSDSDILLREKQGSITWKDLKNVGIVKEVSSPAASLLILLRTNMKHAHAAASSHTQLTSIKETDGGPSLRGGLRSRLSATLREKKRRKRGGRKRLLKKEDISDNWILVQTWATMHTFSLLDHMCILLLSFFEHIKKHVQFGRTYIFSTTPRDN